MSPKIPVSDFANKITQLGLSFSDEQMNLMVRFCELIADYSKHTNLVGNPDLAVLLNDHVLDSLTLVPYLARVQATKRESKEEGQYLHLVDLGTGAGFPAMVLAIAFPQLKVTMLEAIGKKCRFLEQASGSLGLGRRVTVINGRAEELAHNVRYRTHFDVATARAVANFDATAEILLPFLRVGGVFLAQKSASQVDDEVKRAEASLPKLDGVLESVDEFDEKILGKERALLVAKKLGPTKGIYPRVWGKIKSDPLGGLG